MLPWRRIAYIGVVLGLALASAVVLRSNRPLPPPPPEVRQQAEKAAPPVIDLGQPIEDVPAQKK